MGAMIVRLPGSWVVFRRARELLWIAWGLWLGWLEVPGAATAALTDRRGARRIGRLLRVPAGALRHGLGP